MITLLSEARKTATFRGAKPETLIHGDTEGHRMLGPNERVHLADGQGEPCVICLRRVGPELPWMDSRDRWERNQMKCEG